MTTAFFDHPILNSPYACPALHWKMDAAGRPTDAVVDSRRRAEFLTPIPRPRKQKTGARQDDLAFGESPGGEDRSAGARYDTNDLINAIRDRVDAWRGLADPADWKVTPETARLLRHWRSSSFEGFRPFFCQVEAVETLIWLTEVAPQLGKTGINFLGYLKNAAAEANPELFRVALKMATGSGKTTVMAMIIAWQIVNAVRRPQSRRFTRGFLVVAPGITIRDRLRVLYPNDPESYYRRRELVPPDMAGDIEKAKIVITNYHAFMLRDRMGLSKGGRSLLQGRGHALNTLETEGQMLRRVMSGLMGLKNIMVINDEAHHCYRRRQGDTKVSSRLSGEDRAEAVSEAEENNETARVWISGLETVKRRLGIHTVVDLSATPFFLHGSGYEEGTLFPWTVSDFSLMDAIESGIVKLPRVPVADNIPGGDMPTYRNLWEHIRPRMPKKGRARAGALDPLALPAELQTALDALYSHYEKTFNLWQEAGIETPPCFIIVCNNTASSKLVYDYVSGFRRETDGGAPFFRNGRFKLFQNYDDDGKPLGRPRTLLIDSRQLESGDALDETFRSAAVEEIERFRAEIIERTGSRRDAENLSDQDLLREVMNTVGKSGRLGESIRCVVSVAMLTEGWDTNTVTHVLGVRAFGTQLLCEQVVGRALRRLSYDVDERGLFSVEYADILGIPFDFTGGDEGAKPQPVRKPIHVHALPERDHLEIFFPRVAGYRTELPEDRLTAAFTEDSVLELTPDLTGPTRVLDAGIIGETVELRPGNLKDIRLATVAYNLTQRLLETRYRDDDGGIPLYLFGQLKAITASWLGQCLRCTGGALPGHLLYPELADMACSRIVAAITRTQVGKRPVKAILDPYNPAGSTAHVNFTTTKISRWETVGPPPKCHVNWVITDSGWEAELCRAAEANERVIAYVKNRGLGFEVPYRYQSWTRAYLPDFILLIDDGHGPRDLLRLVLEVKGYRGEDAKEKKLTMETLWIPGVNNLGAWGRWAFAEFTEAFDMEEGLKRLVEGRTARIGERKLTSSSLSKNFNPRENNDTARL